MSASKKHQHELLASNIDAISSIALMFKHNLPKFLELKPPEKLCSGCL